MYLNLKYVHVYPGVNMVGDWAIFWTGTVGIFYGTLITLKIKIKVLDDGESTATQAIVGWQQNNSGSSPRHQL